MSSGCVRWGIFRRFIPFDFAVWGGGWADGRLINDLVTLDQSQSVLWDWQTVADQDAFCDLTIARLGQTARFDDVPDYRGSVAYNEHWRRFDARQMMATIQAEPTDGYVSFVGLCADAGPRFSADQRDFKKALMPHLSQALRMNRGLSVGRAAAGQGAVVLVNDAGWVLASEGPFEDISVAEWRRRLVQFPPEVMGALLEQGTWRGRVTTATLSPVEDGYFIRLTSQPARARLSDRERQVADLFAAGHTYKQVARRLETSPSTVRNQLARVYEKLGVSNKAALARLVRQP